MPKLEVYDPALCCSSGVCGPNPDQQLSRFSADLDWLTKQGVEVRRYNLAQEPTAFAQSPEISGLLHRSPDALPALLIDGRLVQSGQYPGRAELASWFGLIDIPAPGGGCCGPSGCC